MKKRTWDNGSVWPKDRPCKIYVGQWPIFHGPLIVPYIIVRLELFLYTMKWHRPGVLVPLWALALVILILMWWYSVVRYTEWKIWKTHDVRVLGGATCSRTGFHRGQENSSMDPKWWIHLLVVPVYQGLFIISGISDLVTVEFWKNNERLSDPPLTDDRALKLVREVTDTDWCFTVGDTGVMCDLKRTTVQYIFKVGV